jgi:hypothetical protein
VLNQIFNNLTKLKKMKKLIFSTILITGLISFGATAQVVRVGTGIGGGKGGINLNVIELAYAPQPALEFGGYFGITAGGSISDANASVEAGARYGLQGKYYFREEGFKPYAGLQLGLLSGGNLDVDVNGTPSNAKAKTKFDYAPMVGFRVGPLNINAAYQKGVRFNVGLLFGFGSF